MMSSETGDDGGVVSMDSIEEGDISNDTESDGKRPIFMENQEFTLLELSDQGKKSGWQRYTIGVGYNFMKWSMAGKDCHLW